VDAWLSRLCWCGSAPHLAAELDAIVMKPLDQLTDRSEPHRDKASPQSISFPVAVSVDGKEATTRRRVCIFIDGDNAPQAVHRLQAVLHGRARRTTTTADRAASPQEETTVHYVDNGVALYKCTVSEAIALQQLCRAEGVRLEYHRTRTTHAQAADMLICCMIGSELSRVPAAGGGHCIIISNDKGFQELVAPGVEVLSFQETAAAECTEAPPGANAAVVDAPRNSAQQSGEPCPPAAPTTPSRATPPAKRSATGKWSRSPWRCDECDLPCNSARQLQQHTHSRHPARRSQGSTRSWRSTKTTPDCSAEAPAKTASGAPANTERGVSPSVQKGPTAAGKLGTDSRPVAEVTEIRGPDGQQQPQPRQQQILQPTNTTNNAPNANYQTQPASCNCIVS